MRFRLQYTVAFVMSDEQSKRSPMGDEKSEGDESRESGGESGGEEISVQLARQPQARLQSDGRQEAETLPRAEDESGHSKREGDQGTSVQAKREERMKRLRELHLRRVSLAFNGSSGVATPPFLTEGRCLGHAWP